MENIHNHEGLLSPELKDELQEFAEKIADIMSPVDDIFVIGIEDDGSLTVINTAGGVLSAGTTVYPLTHEAVATGSFYDHAAILEYINNCFTEMMPSPLEQELEGLCGWYSYTFGGYEDVALSTTQEHLLVTTKYTPEISVSRADYTLLHAACRNRDELQAVRQQVSAMLVQSHEAIQDNRVREYLNGSADTE